MPIVHYSYEKSKIVEDSVEVPQEVIDKGDKYVRNWIFETVWSEDYSYGPDSENEEVTFTVEQAA